MGAYFDDMEEIRRNPVRFEFYEGLRSLGVPAALAPYGAPAEQDIWGKSRGTVNISKGPIRWVQVRTEICGDDDEYLTDYAVPDTRLCDLDTSRLEIKCTATGGFWPFRAPSGVRWRGNDLGLGMLQRLDEDTSLAGPLLGRVYSRRAVTIKAPARRGYWTIIVPGGITGLASLVTRRPMVDIPKLDQWHCYQAIAQHLLDTPIPA
jgi:hypothetical protein